MKKRPPVSDKVEQQMTPMIDIVFQLLTFFVMTFKVPIDEGNFDIKMPLPAQGSGPPPQKKNFTVKLTSIKSGAPWQIGHLAKITFDGKPIPVKAPLDPTTVSSLQARANSGVSGAEAAALLAQLNWAKSAMDELHTSVRGQLARSKSLIQEGEYEIDADENLRFGYVLSAMDMIANHRGEDLGLGPGTITVKNVKLKYKPWAKRKK